ncbi:hypothetical protein pipiens_002195 [Culex pipiens pipiens]|uniref:Uncharacterized protein n=1 Tax=Culex pipiens pipiens TaxID=38569 RepID=A0ABD1DIM9_CULPP
MGFLSKYEDGTAVYRRRSQSEDDNPPSLITMEDPHGGPASIGSTFLGGGSMRDPQSSRDPASPQLQGMGGGASQNHPNFNMTSPPVPHMPHPSHPPDAVIPVEPSPMSHLNIASSTK